MRTLIGDLMFYEYVDTEEITEKLKTNFEEKVKNKGFRIIRKLNKINNRKSYISVTSFKFIQPCDNAEGYFGIMQARTKIEKLVQNDNIQR